MSHPLVLYASHLVFGVRPVNWLKPGTGCPEGLWGLHPRRYWGAIWTQFCAAGSGWSCSSKGYGPPEVPSNLYHSVILKFRKMYPEWWACVSREKILVLISFPSYHSPTNMPLNESPSPAICCGSRTSQIELCRPLWLKDCCGGALLWLLAGKPSRLNGIFLLPHWSGSEGKLPQL